MAFLPFYLPRKERIKVIIVGGGYAGMAALTALTRYAENIEITLIDPREKHIKVTHLHETFRYPLSDLQVSFADLAARFGFRHIQEKLLFDEDTLQQWQVEKCITLNDEVVVFDYLLIASGSGEAADQQTENVLNLQDFMTSAGSDLLSNHLVKNDKTEHSISIIGGGATGIQFLFETEQFLRRKKINAKLRLIHSGHQVLEQFPKGFDSDVQSCMQDFGIEFLPNTYYREQQAENILLEEKQSNKQFTLPSDLTLLFLGKKQKKILVANAFGQLLIDQKVLQHIFVAGDCSFYNSFGSNILAAQSAVRKGKLAARNILRHSSVIGLLEPYLHHELGYVVSLGSADAVGWLVSEGNVVSGMPALAIKELVETQYDLLLVGVDTYLI